MQFSTEKKFPVVLAFHGGGGSARNTIAQYHFNPLADAEGFVVVYPNGLERGWNDGRIAPKKSSEANDVQFVSDLIDHLAKQYGTDPKRVFATGISNGAIFSIYLAYKLPAKIRAIAPVCGSMPENLETNFKLERPISAMFINGTLDPLVKYGGGPVVSERAGRGAVISTEKLVGHWRDYNGCIKSSKTELIPDTANDRCSASMTTYADCSNSTEVVLVKIEGGGHTWPGGKQYAPRMMIGEVCRDFDAEQIIWAFFKRQKPIP